jgi:1-deoxyxylulose-5-phosphate synthase
MLYFHLYDKETPIEESLAAIEDLVQRDLVRYFGVSNFTVDHLEQYQAMEKRLSPRCRAVAVQNRLDILRGEQADKKGVLRFCADHGVSFVPYSPLAGGLLSDRYVDLSKVGRGDRLFDEGSLSKVAEQALLARQQALAALAHEWGIELSQLALAYMLTLPGMGSLIPAASTVQQLESNAQAGKITLSEEQKMLVRAIVEL